MNVVRLQTITTLDLDPNVVLEAAMGNLDAVIVIGYHKDGTEYFASSVADGGTAMWLIERCKKALLEVET